MEKGGGSAAAPTGCYKCGRPGHWSRDCPSNPSQNETNKDTTRSNGSGGSAYYPDKRSKNSFTANKAEEEKPKRVPRTRPKLTPDLLLSENGLGHILRHFPRAFKFRGRGHEISDLRNLLGLYAEWHSRLLPYFSFDQFVHKVEQIGAKNRVKKCIRELRERVANGVDPTKLHESEIQGNMPNHDQDAMDLEEQNPIQENTNVQHPIDDNVSVQNPDADILQENILNEIWENAIEEPSQASNNKIVVADASSGDKETPKKSLENTASPSNGIMMSEEQRARMQANRLKALEKAAAARARNIQ